MFTKKGGGYHLSICASIHLPTYLHSPTFSPVPSKHRTPNDEHALLLAPHPLHDLHRALRQRRARRVRRRNSIQLEQRRAPRERHPAAADLVVDLERRGPRV